MRFKDLMITYYTERFCVCTYFSSLSSIYVNDFRSLIVGES